MTAVAFTLHGEEMSERDRCGSGEVAHFPPAALDLAARTWTVEQVRQRLRIARRRADLPAAIPLIDLLADLDAEVVKLYAEGIPWKWMCEQLGVSRATANRHLQHLLTVIVWRLNGREIPTRWSRRDLLDRERELSSDEQHRRVDCVRHLKVGQPPRAASSIDPTGRIEHEDASTSRRRGDPADREAAAENR